MILGNLVLEKALFKLMPKRLMIVLGMFVLGVFILGGNGSALAAEKATYVGTETCASCHEKEFKEYQMSTHARIQLKDDSVEAQGCEMCHGPGSLHADAGGGRNTPGHALIINPRENPNVCFNCHMDKKLEFRLPYHHPVLEGKMSCVDCHENLHGPEAKPWSAVTMEGTNEVCFKCHKDQQGPFVYEHQALREGCTACHKVHGGINDKMLNSRQVNLCLRCHQQVNFPTIGESGHAGNRLGRGTCWASGCHFEPHGSNYNDHFRD